MTMHEIHQNICAQKRSPSKLSNPYKVLLVAPALVTDTVVNAVKNFLLCSGRLTVGLAPKAFTEESQ